MTAPSQCDEAVALVDPIVKATNADAAVWGDLLIKSKHVGAIRQGGPPNGKTHTVPPGAGQAVESMDDQLLAGLFSNGLHKDTGYLMVVDLRASMSLGGVKPRSVTLTIASACKATVEPGGAGGYAEQHPHPPNNSAAAGSTGQITLTLSGGGGALLKLEPSSGADATSAASCGAILRSARQWWFDPRAINLKHAYPEISVKVGPCIHGLLSCVVAVRPHPRQSPEMSCGRQATSYDAWGATANHAALGGLHPAASSVRSPS